MRVVKEKNKLKNMIILQDGNNKNQKLATLKSKNFEIKFKMIFFR